jgi:hypothetical protein
MSVEQRVRAALAERAAEITADRLQPARPPTMVVSAWPRGVRWLPMLAVATAAIAVLFAVILIVRPSADVPAGPATPGPASPGPGTPGPAAPGPASRGPGSPAPTSPTPAPPVAASVKPLPGRPSVVLPPGEKGSKPRAAVTKADMRVPPPRT